MGNDERIIELLEQLVAGLARIEKSQARIEQATVPLRDSHAAGNITSGYVKEDERRRAAAGGGEAA